MRLTMRSSEPLRRSRLLRPTSVLPPPRSSRAMLMCASAQTLRAAYGSLSPLGSAVAELRVVAMTTFAADCSDEEIRKAVVEWSECLAQGKYAAALCMFPHTSESFDFEWTPEHLEDWISNYGCARKDYDSGEHRKVTSLFEQPDHQRFIRKAIKVDREHCVRVSTPGSMSAWCITTMFRWTESPAI